MKIKLLNLNSGKLRKLFKLFLCFVAAVFKARFKVIGAIDIYLSGLLARRQNAWSQDGGNMSVIANGVNR